MASKFVRAGGGNWTADATWSTTSGGAADTVAPTAADDCFADAASGQITLDADSVCRSVNFTGYTGTYTHNATFTLSIGDGTAGASNIALKFVSGMTTSFGSPSSAAISFVSTSATVQSVDFAGKNTSNVTFNGVGGSWQLSGNWGTSGINVSQVTTLTNGTFDTNGQTIFWGSFASSNSNTRTLTLGASAITFTGASRTVWNTGTSTNMTFNANTSSITCSGAGVTFTPGTSQTFNTVAFTGSGNATLGGNATYANLTRIGTAVKTDAFVIGGGSNVVTGIITLAGNSATNRVLVFGQTVGTIRTITTTGATMTWSNVDFQDFGVSAAYDASAITGNSGDCGGNTGITFTTPSTKTWNGTSGGNWSANTWSGTGVPLPQDTANLGKSFSASQTITADMPRLAGSIDWTGATGAPTWTNSTAVSSFGSVTLAAGMSTSGTNAYTLCGRSSYTITCAGVQLFAGDLILLAPGGTYSLSDNLIIASNKALTITNGSFVTNNFDMAMGVFSSNNSNTRAITLGTSTISLQHVSVFTTWNITTTTGLTFSGASSTIVFSTVGTGIRTFAGGSLTYGTLTYTVAESTFELDITGSNSFAVINFSDASNARSLKLTAGTTTTIRNANGFNVQGTAGKLMSVVSITGTAFTLTSTNQQSCNYLSLTNCVVDATPKWYAGANSTDGGGNTNWIFTAAPAGVSYPNVNLAERAYFVRKAGGAVPTEPLNNIKRRYIVGFVGGNIPAQTSLPQLEKLWLGKLLSAAGITYPGLQNVEELWRLAVISISKTPTSQLNNNKMTFFINAS